MGSEGLVSTSHFFFLLELAFQVSGRIILVADDCYKGSYWESIKLRVEFNVFLGTIGILSQV